MQKSTLQTVEREKQFDELQGAIINQMKGSEAVIAKQPDIDQLQLENEHLHKKIDRLEKED